MSMTERVQQLRRQSLEAVESLSSERAELLTAFYQAQDLRLVSTPVQRALAFQYLLEHKAICIHPGELIVGEKGPVPKAAPTFPELCCHSLADLDIHPVKPDIRRGHARQAPFRQPAGAAGGAAKQYQGLARRLAQALVVMEFIEKGHGLRHGPFSRDSCPGGHRRYAPHGLRQAISSWNRQGVAA